MGPPPHDSEALLSLAPLQKLETKNVLIVKGCEGRNKLAAEIQRRGGRVQELDVYSRLLPQLEKTTFENVVQVDFILFTSSESANNLFKLLPKTLYPKVLGAIPVVGHERIAVTIDQLGFKKSPIIAASPNDNAMLNALVQYVTNGDPE